MLIALFAAMAAQSAGSEHQLFQDFEFACGRFDRLAIMEQLIVGADWERFTPAPESDVGRLVVAINDAPPRFRVDTRTYRRSRTSRVVVLVSEVAAPDGSQSTECKALLADASQPDASDLTRWAGRPATNVRTQEGTTMWTWTPGVHTDAPVTAILHVPSGLRPRYPNFGTSITAIRMQEGHQ